MTPAALREARIDDSVTLTHTQLLALMYIIKSHLCTEQTYN